MPPVRCLARATPQVWPMLAGCQGLKQRSPRTYDSYLQHALAPENASKHTCKDGTIDKDIPRTFPESAQFQEKGGMGQRKMRHVLFAYHSYNPELGYTQVNHDDQLGRARARHAARRDDATRRDETRRMRAHLRTHARTLTWPRAAAARRAHPAHRRSRRPGAPLADAPP